MQYIKGLSQYESDRASAVTFGKFDGLHKGHQKLVRKVQELSGQHKVNSIVCAFDMHPLWKDKGIVPQTIMDKKDSSVMKKKAIVIFWRIMRQIMGISSL